MLGIQYPPPDQLPAGKTLREELLDTEDRVHMKQTTCLFCPHFQDDRCKLCGCGGVLSRLKFKNARCPDGRWNTDNSEVG